MLDISSIIPGSAVGLRPILDWYGTQIHNLDLQSAESITFSYLMLKWFGNIYIVRGAQAK